MPQFTPTAGARTAEQIQKAVGLARQMDALIGRLTYDRKFATDLANNPRETLAAARLLLDREAVETLITVDPERFDKACEALFDLVDSDFLHKIVMPSCDSAHTRRRSPYQHEATV
ncbi:hypothetical protein [Actinomadura oligospora]|uniref:hypothetical protein n=1 Tax=Actinomadura oligospora TaxID=111804 RepID=UPI00047C2A12|nr:hypothetical protein [Actinomadura oligospora]